MHKQQIKGSLLLLLTASIWGVSFVAQHVGMDHVSPFTFNGIRTFLGGVVLLPIVLAKRHQSRTKGPSSINWHTTAIGGVVCGVCLFAASTLQQHGIAHTTVGKAGFITAFYIVLVPILGLFFKRKTGPSVWIAVALALVGLYLLCINNQMSINTGDMLILACSLLFAVHILVIDYFSPRSDGVTLSCIQFFVCAALCLLPMLVLEHPQFAAIWAARLPILYTGVLSCGIAYTLQVIGQKGMNPTVAALILSLESCISVLAGWILLGQTLSLREALGCGIMLAAILLAQLPTPARKKQKAA